MDLTKVELEGVASQSHLKGTDCDLWSHLSGEDSVHHLPTPDTLESTSSGTIGMAGGLVTHDSGGLATKQDSNKGVWCVGFLDQLHPTGELWSSGVSV